MSAYDELLVRYKGMLQVATILNGIIKRNAAVINRNDPQFDSDLAWAEKFLGAICERGPF